MDKSYCRDFSKDKYEYRQDGLYFVNSETDRPRYYPRYKISRNGIDVSKWQGDINWCEVSKSGVEFAIIREGYGKKSPNQLDRHFHKNIREAQSNDIKCGVYHFSYALSEDDARAEASFCLENISDYKFEYPVIFDIEVDKNSILGRKKLTDICMAFCNKMRENGYYVSIYTNLNWVNNFLYSDKLFVSYDLWLARYNVWGAGYVCGIWQYTPSGSVRGIKGNVDLNICYFDYPKMIKELGLNGF